MRSVVVESAVGLVVCAERRTVSSDGRLVAFGTVQSQTLISFPGRGRLGSSKQAPSGLSTNPVPILKLKTCLDVVNADGDKAHIVLNKVKDTLLEPLILDSRLISVLFSCSKV